LQVGFPDPQRSDEFAQHAAPSRWASEAARRSQTALGTRARAARDCLQVGFPASQNFGRIAQIPAQSCRASEDRLMSAGRAMRARMFAGGPPGLTVFCSGLGAPRIYAAVQWRSPSSRRMNTAGWRA